MMGFALRGRQDRGSGLRLLWNIDDVVVGRGHGVVMVVLLYGGTPIRIVAVSKVGLRSGLVRDPRHGLNGAPEEAAIRGTLPEGSPTTTTPAAGTVILDGSVREAAPAGLGGQAAAQRLDLLGDEGGGGDVRVAEVADLLQRLPGSRHGVHVQRRQVDIGGGELLVGAVVLRAKAVNPVMKVLQVDLLVVLMEEKEEEEKRREGGREGGRKGKGRRGGWGEEKK